MHSFLDSAILAMTFACSIGLAFTVQKMALAFLLKAMDRNHRDRTVARKASAQT